MHFFNTREYEEYAHRTFLYTKKNLEASIEMKLKNQKHLLKSDSQQLYNCQAPSGDLLVYYQGNTTSLPNVLLTNIDMKELLEYAYKDFTVQQKQSLLQLLPSRNETIISDILKGKQFKFGNPVDNFDKQLKSGYFTKMRQKQEQLTDMLSLRHRINYSKELLDQIVSNKDSYKVNKKYWIPEMSQLSSIQDLCPSEDFQSASEETQTQQLIEDENQNVEIEVNEVFFKYEDKRKTQQEIIAMSDDKGGQYKTTKIVKPMLVQTKIVRSQDWVQVFRKQQEDRYRNPTKAYTYVCQDGTKVTVAAVAKKIVSGVGKPRQHIMLRNQRPSCVTILTLVRDAAARLPGGVGTRADICELLKQSQYVNQDIGDDKINTIVSGALDRLHYMTDACVKYDSQKKLWQYLHLQRTGSVKDEDNQEYKQKKAYKKKKGGQEEDNEL